MNQRRDSGATLAFVATSIVVVIMIALAFYFLTQLIGGGRELQHATDSGTTNVAKQATINPAIPLPNTPAGNLTNMKTVLSAAADTNGKVDLLTFNNMVGQAMLVAMNAEADSGPQALNDAASFIDLVEGANGTGGVGSIGGSLQSALNNPLTPDANGNPWAKTAFENTGMANSLRMLGNTSQVAWQQTDFKALYYGQAPNDPNETNVAVDNLVNNEPFKNVNSLAPNFNPGALQASRQTFPATGTVAQNGKTLIKGYNGINFSSVGRNLYAVPLDANPHLISMNTVQTSSNQPGISDQVKLPPNAFINGALGMDQRKSHQNVHVLAAAVAGTNRQPFPIQLKYDYILVDNAGSNNSYTPPSSSMNNVFANELMSGITVDRASGYFSDQGQGSGNPVYDWENTPRTADAQGNPFDPNSGPSVQHMFDENGDPVASKQQAASKIPYTPGGGSTVCNDTNSDPGPNGVDTCIQHATPPSGPGSDPFDHAYYPNGTGGGSAGQGTPDTLTAAEQTCGKVIDFWNRATAGTVSLPGSVSLASVGTTGLRLYPASNNPIQGNETPWGPPGQGFNQHSGANAGSYSDPNTPCKVTSDGTIAQLIDQTVGRTADPNKNPLSDQAQSAVLMIKQRMAEISGDVNLANNDYDAVVKQKALALGSKYYIYLNPQTNHFVMDGNPPPWFSRNNASVTSADGTPINMATARYGVAQSVGDPAHQWNIHARPMLTIESDTLNENTNLDPNSNDSAKATDSVNITPGSGATGNLMNITFLESVADRIPQGVSLTDRD